MLFLCHLHIKGLLNAVGQVFQHVPLQTAQHKREYFSAQCEQCVLVVVLLYGCGIAAVEVFKRAEHGGIEEAEERIQFREVVLHGCSAQCEPVVGFQQECRLGSLSGGVLDVLAFVEDDIVKHLFAECLHVIAHDGVCGENHLVLHGTLDVPFLCVIGIYRQLGRKAFDFVLPVEEQASGHHYECRFLFLGIDERQHTDGLHCLSESHVIGKTTSELVVIQVFNPFDALLLVWAQFCLEFLGGESLLMQFVESLIYLAVMLEGISLQRSVD